jgi:hypothetical protein
MAFGGGDSGDCWAECGSIEEAGTMMSCTQFSQPNVWGVVYLPLFRPEHRSFWRTRPAGERQGCRSFSQGQGWPFENPRQKREAQDQGGIRVAFSLDTFFWPSKRMYLGCRAETRHKKSRRDSDTTPKLTQNIE